MADAEEAVYGRLNDLGIAFTRHEHPPVATVDEAERYWAGLDAVHWKNLFLRNQKGTQHYLVIVGHSKRADLRSIADQIGDGKLSFASPERLMTHLGVTPGSVGLRDVSRELWQFDQIRYRLAKVRQSSGAARLVAAAILMSRECRIDVG